MTTAAIPMVDPESRPRQGWVAMLANRISRGAGDNDPDVQAARSALAYHRIAKAIADERDPVSPAGLDRLVAQLRNQQAAVTR